MRVWIGIAGGGDSRRVEIRLDSVSGQLLAQRTMSVLIRAPWVAPTEHADPDATETAGAITAEITEGRSRGGGVVTLGEYLFESLIGDETWSQIVEAAKRRRVNVIELALSWSADERDLHAPPWEAMHDGVAFLAAHDQLTVAITRVAGGIEGSEELSLPRIPAPARVLFAIGTRTNDPDLRVGMEVIGLLRAAERGAAGITPMFLQNASVERLRKACAGFSPHLVQFVSHGRVARGGGGELQLPSSIDGETEWVGAEQLLEALGAGDRSPFVVVLTGCKSAATGAHVDPLASELVNRGIPAAVGMAGRISDPVCRLFARQFGAALSQGEPLITALADGRRAGLREQVAAAGDDPAWVLPSIYLNRGVSADQRLVDASRRSAALTRVKGYDLRLDPVFCGRAEIAQLFDDLLDPDEELNTLVSCAEGSNEKLGKTRLTHEFAARALRRGHLVVFINDLGNDITLLPRTAVQLAADLLTAMVDARERFGLDAPSGSLLARELERAGPVRLELRADDNPSYRRGRTKAFARACRDKHDELEGSQLVGGLREYLAEDLRQLAADARAHPDGLGPDRRVVAILGGIGNWGEVTEILCETLFGPFGLGTESEPVPTFASCATEDAPEPLRRARENARGSRSVRYESLGRFADSEETLAYLTVLLHPSSPPDSRFPRLPPYVPNDGHQGDYHWDDALRHAIKGIPGNFGEPLHIVAPVLAGLNSLLEADDDDVLANYRRQPWAP